MKNVENDGTHLDDVEQRRDELYRAIMKKMNEDGVTFNDLVDNGYVGSSNTARRLQQGKNMNIESLISIAKALGCKIVFEQ